MPPRSEDASESKELLTPCRKCGRSEDLILGHSHFFELRFGVSVRVVRNCALTNNISSRLNNNCEVLLYTTPDETVCEKSTELGLDLVLSWSCCAQPRVLMPRQCRR
jgi:hypothetical protein